MTANQASYKMKYTSATGKIFEVKQTGEMFFYWSTSGSRWFPVKKELVVFS